MKKKEFKVTKEQVGKACFITVGAVVGCVIGIKYMKSDRFLLSGLPDNVSRTLSDVYDSYNGRSCRCLSCTIPDDSKLKLTLDAFGEVGKALMIKTGCDANKEITHFMVFTPGK